MATLTPDRLWQLTQQHLKNVLGTEKYTAYLETAVLIEKQDDLWRIGVRDEEARAWLSNGSYTAVANALSSIVGQPVRLEFFDLDLPPLERKPKDDGRPSTPEAAWKATLGELELQMSRSTFQSWLADAELLRVEGDCWVIGVRNEYAVEWLENRLNDTITRTLVAIYGQPVDLVFVVGKGASKANGRGPEPPPNWEEPEEPATTPNPPRKKKAKPMSPVLDDDATTGDQAEIALIEDSDPTYGHLQTSHYALRFWRPYLGLVPFTLWETLRSYGYFVKEYKAEWPTVATLADTIGQGDRYTLLGRVATASRPAQTGAIERLKKENVIKHVITGNGKQTHHYFAVVKRLPMLTPTQLSQLSQRKQKEHLNMLKKYYKEFDLDGWRDVQVSTFLKPIK